MSALRIVSFLPAATEMACALGLESELVGVSHECDFPDGVRSKPVVSRNALPVERMTPAEIDAAVTARLREGRSLYEIDEPLLARLAPTHLLTQSLCDVCAPSGNEVTRALKRLPAAPELLCFTPHRIEEIHADLLALGGAVGRVAEAERLVEASRARMRAIAERTASVGVRPRVLFLEWTEPLFSAGHWVPEMIALAGGDDALGRAGADSVRLRWVDVAAWDPEVLIISPCGMRLPKALELASALIASPEWRVMHAVRAGRVYAVDANAYFARPGPRVAEGVALLAHLIHPEHFAWSGAAGVYGQVRPSEAPLSLENGPPRDGSDRPPRLRLLGDLSHPPARDA